jgi:hypothetical protein
VNPARRAARELLDLATTRGTIKRLAERLDQDPELRRAVWEEGNARGAGLDEDALGWTATKLLRKARARETDARERLNPIRRDEAFTCLHCGLEVGPLGRTARDHCPRCLRSQHVDVVPGDRASECGALMDPVGAELVAGSAVLHHLCRRCGARRRVRAVEDDDWEAVTKTSAGEPPP